MSQEQPNRHRDRSDKRIPAALPIRVTYWDKDVKPRPAMACTYDISLHGARMTIMPGITAPGEILAIEQGYSKACCRVVRIGDSDSQCRGQMGIQCIEPEVTLWTSELRYMQQLYDPMVQEKLLGRINPLGSANHERRRHQRFQVRGLVELSRQGAEAEAIQAELRDISSFGCLITPTGPIGAGTDLKLFLNVASYDLRLKGRVLHSSGTLGLGIEFREIRKGDRQLLEHLLRKLDSQSLPAKPLAGAARNAG